MNPPDDAAIGREFMALAAKHRRLPDATKQVALIAERHRACLPRWCEYRQIASCEVAVLLAALGAEGTGTGK